VNREQAERLAEEWYAGWNAHNLERILSHYRDDVVFVSPFVADIAGRADGRLEGKEALRDYFGAALSRFPDLAFEPIALLVGVDSLVLHYRSVEDRLAAELMIVGDDGLVRESVAHYG
jgi:ketosteroid isomerase-like protein